MVLHPNVLIGDLEAGGLPKSNFYQNLLSSVTPHHGSWHSSEWRRIQGQLVYKSVQLNSIEKSLRLLNKIDDKLDNVTLHNFASGSGSLNTRITFFEDIELDLNYFPAARIFPTLGSCSLELQPEKTLAALVEEYCLYGSSDILEDIHQWFSDVRAVASTEFEKLSKETRSLRRKLNLFFRRRNLRSYFRHIIQFLFKNMDDESDSRLIALVPESINLQFLNTNNGIHKIYNRSNQ